MRQRAALLIIATAFVFVVPERAEAHERGRTIVITNQWKRPAQSQSWRYVQPPLKRPPGHPDLYYYERYPKYYGGFHSRFLHTYGYPQGYVGLRGYFPW